jgi:undecaprenyl-diphosphatase
MLENLITYANQIDVFIFYIINLNLQNHFFDEIMPIITNMGFYLFLFGICIILAIFGGEKGRNVAIILFIGILLGHLISELLKYIFLRPRPYEALTGIHQLLNVPSPSFPSGHATEAFIAAIILAKNYGHLVIFIILALIVCFSRIYMGVHYPTDVLAGALLGVGISIIVLHFEDNILKLKNRFIHR